MLLRGHRAQGAGVPEATGFVRVGVNSEQKDSSGRVRLFLNHIRARLSLIHFRFSRSHSKLPSDSFINHLYPTPD